MMISDFLRKAKTFFPAHSKYLKPFLFFIWLILFAILGWQIWESRDQIPLYLQKFTWEIIIKILLFYFLALLFAILGWISIFNAFIPSISIKNHFKFYMASMAARRLPGTIWYISGRAVFYKTLGVSKIVTSSASGIEVMISLLANCLVAIIIIPFTFTSNKLFDFVYLILGILIAILIIHPKTLTWLMKKIDRPLIQPFHFWQPIIWVLFRVTVIICGTAMVYQIVGIFFPLGKEIFWLTLRARALSGAASFLTFLLPSSLGAADITLVAILATKLSINVAGLVAIAVRLLTTFFDIILGSIFFLTVNKTIRSEDVV